MSAIGMTSTEIAAAAEMPVREVNQLIDDRVLPARFVRTEGGRRLIAEDGLVFVFLETIASEKLAPAERRKVGEAMIENKKLWTFADGIVRIDVLRVRREIAKRLDRLKRARAMVTSDPSVMGGLPCFRGTRIPVHDVAGMLRAGDSMDVVLRHYPSLDGAAVELAGMYAEAYPRRGRPPRRPSWREGLVVHKDVVPRKRIALVVDAISTVVDAMSTK